MAFDDSQPPAGRRHLKEKKPPKGKEARQPRKVTPRYLENAALYYLQRYSSSSANLRRILATKVWRSTQAHDTNPDEGAEIIEDIITRFLHSGLLDDRAYAEAKAATFHRRGTSARGIRSKLAAKGVSPEIIECALETLHVETPEPEHAAAITLARRRRFGPFHKPAATNREKTEDGEAKKRRRMKELAAMARAGFSYELARLVIDATDLQTLEETLDQKKFI